MIKFVFSETLESINYTMNRFSRESQIRSNTIIDYTKGTASRLDTVTLDAMINFLNKLSLDNNWNRQFTIDDIIRHIPDDDKKANGD